MEIKYAFGEPASSGYKIGESDPGKVMMMNKAVMKMIVLFIEFFRWFAELLANFMRLHLCLSKRTIFVKNSKVKGTYEYKQEWTFEWDK